MKHQRYPEKPFFEKVTFKRKQNNEGCKAQLYLEKKTSWAEERAKAKPVSREYLWMPRNSEKVNMA